MKFVLLLVFPLILYSPKKEVFKYTEQLCYDTALDISSESSSDANRIADSLLNYSENARQKMYALMLKSIVLEHQDKRAEAIAFSLKSLKIAKEEKDYCLESRIYTFLSRQYRNIGFIDKGKDLIAESLMVCSKIEDKDHAVKFMTMANLELIEYDIEFENYERAIVYLKTAAFSLDKEREGKIKYFDLANCEEKLARCYLQMGNDMLALNHYRKASTFINKSKLGESLWANKIYDGLIDIYLSQQELDSAKVYIQKNLLIHEKFDNNVVKEHVYKTTAEYYRQTEVRDSFELYTSKYKLTALENKENMRGMINTASNTLYNLTDDIPDASDTPYKIGAMELIFLIGIPSIGVYYQRKKLVSYMKGLIISRKLRKRSQKAYSNKTETILLAKLEEFENSNGFLDNNLSLPILVAKLQTNVKYLRQIIRDHKHTDFNTYINKLRIQYIIEKLNSDPAYLNYKISFLAKESGFSSHSQFSTNFKKFTDNSPSEYISNLKSKIAS